MSLTYRLPVRRRYIMSHETLVDNSDSFEVFLKGKTYREIVSSQGCYGASRALAEWLVTHGVKVLAVDFDLTMTTVHSGGHIDPKDDRRGVLKSLSNEFNEFAEYCLSVGLRIACVTFSDAKTVERLPLEMQSSRIGGAALIHKVLESCDARFSLEKIYAYWPENYKHAEAFRKLNLAAPMEGSKSFHLRKLRADFGVKPSEVVLIDDDLENCRQARVEGHLAVNVYPPQGFAFQRLRTLNKVSC